MIAVIFSISGINLTSELHDHFLTKKRCCSIIPIYKKQTHLSAIITMMPKNGHRAELINLPPPQWLKAIRIAEEAWLVVSFRNGGHGFLPVAGRGGISLKM